MFIGAFQLLIMFNNCFHFDGKRLTWWCPNV